MPILSGDIARQIADHMEKQLKLKEDAMINGLQYIGEEAINAQKQVSKEQGFEDQTGNLRSSYGYRLVNSGKLVVEGGFEQIRPTADQGVKEGQDFAKKIADENKSGTSLVLVAGMDYAAAVASRGKDVLDTAELIARREVRQLNKDLTQ